MRCLILLAALAVVCVQSQNVASGAFKNQDFPREVTKVIYVTNGAEAGHWRRGEFCPIGSYAAGFELKHEPTQPLVDDSGLNAIQLVCLARDPEDNLSYGTADDHNGPWGEWKGRLMCTGATPDERYFMTRYRLRVEPDGLTGHRGATNVEFACSDIDNHFNQYGLEGNGGDEGSYGVWSESCPDGTAICGINVKFETPNYIDEAAVTDAAFACCVD